MGLGPVILDIEGRELTAEDRELLKHPAVGGMILFTRNYESREQLTRLTQEIHALRDPHLLIAVDQEGGRVQRFRDGFAALPPPGHFGHLYDKDARKARESTELVAWLMAVELLSAGVDFSFAPVLDLNIGVSEVIGDRAFHSKPMVVSDLAKAWVRGMHGAGMAAVGKHFPGHGHVAEDSHVCLPVDKRRMEDVRMEDLIPFENLIRFGLEAIMPAHVVFERIDPNLAGCSEFWLKRVLRKELGFQGVIFSDDLNMSAADAAGSFSERAMASVAAGCDVVLVCNNRPGAVEAVEALSAHDDPAAHLRMMRMHGKKRMSYSDIQLDSRWKAARDVLARLDDPFELSLDL